MFITIPKENSVEVLDASTRVRKYTIYVGKIVGAPLVQGTDMTVYVQESTKITTKVYNLNTGQLKYTV